jgi:hypothetical protein
MRTHFLGVMFSLALLVFFSLAMYTEAGPRPEPAQGGARQQFDPRDLSGIYIRRGGDRGFGPPAGIPPLTPAGEAVIKNVLSPGRSRHPLVKNVGDPAQSNDPAFSCNPKGFPRIVLDTAHDFHEVIMLPNRILQLWQEERRPREIWMDGRAIPRGENLDNIGPAWYGHSVGEWQRMVNSARFPEPLSTTSGAITSVGREELVVTTVGMDDRAWLDSFGFPKSVNARIEERYRRVDAETLELRLTLYDSTYYTRPWVSDAKIWKKEPRENVTYFGWYGLFSGLGELICAPMNASPVNKRGG